VNPRPVTGAFVSASASGRVAPGTATYGINFNKGDGSPVIGVTGFKSAFPKIWPDYALVEPQRLIGQRVSGLELPDGRVWWLFVEPPASFQCSGGTTGAGALEMLRASGGIPQPPTTGGGGSSTGSPSPPTGGGDQ